MESYISSYQKNYYLLFLLLTKSVGTATGAVMGRNDGVVMAFMDLLLPMSAVAPLAFGGGLALAVVQAGL